MRARRRIRINCGGTCEREVAACELSKAGHRTLVATMGKKATILNGELELELS